MLVCELTPTTVNLEAQFWVNSRKQSFLLVTSQVLAAIKLILHQAKTAEATPALDIASEPMPD